MKVVVIACLLSNPNVCKTLAGEVAWIDTHTECARAIKEKAQEYPEWFVKTYKCEKTG